MTAQDKSTLTPALSASGVPRTKIEPEDYRFLQDYVYRESGIVLDADKHYLLDARLSPILRTEGLSTVRDLCNLLRGVRGKPIHRRVVEAMTTNETLFFREQYQYEALRTSLIPKLAATRVGTRRLTFWSAAASTGQEAYSLAMLLLELGYRDWNIQILGTDINETVLEKARMGRYLQIEVNRGLPAAYLVKYFDRHGLEWQIKEDVRRMVHWQRMDLRSPFHGKGPYDFVFCRNVLIYFDPATKRKILSEMRKTIVPGGYLFLGGAETIADCTDLYRRVDIGSAILHQPA